MEHRSRAYLWSPPSASVAVSAIKNHSHWLTLVLLPDGTEPEPIEAIDAIQFTTNIERASQFARFDSMSPLLRFYAG